MAIPVEMKMGLGHGGEALKVAESNIPSSAASRRKPPFHGLHENIGVGFRHQSWWVQRGQGDEPSVFGAGQTSEVGKYTRSKWAIEGSADGD